jgi:hypothetical protein
MEGDRPELRAKLIGVRETELWSAAVRDCEPVRQARRHQILDIVHGDFHRDPMGTVERIYAFIGEPLSPHIATAMRARVAAAPERSHGEHRYDARDFGLRPAKIRECFGDYVQRFDLIGWEAGRAKVTATVALDALPTTFEALCEPNNETKVQVLAGGGSSVARDFR